MIMTSVKLLFISSASSKVSNKILQIQFQENAD